MLVTQNEAQMRGTFDKIPGSYYLSSVYTVYKRQMLRLWASKIQLVFMLLMPLMWLAIIGTTFNNFIPAGILAPGLNYLTFMTPGVLIMVTMFTGLFGAISLFYDKDSGYLKNYMIAPINRTAIITGYTLAVATRIIIQDTILLGVALALGAKIEFGLVDVISIYVYAILTTFFLMGLAITIASKAPNVETFQNIIMPISMPLQFLSPVMYPISKMPDPLQFIGYINPLTYGVDGLRSILISGSADNPIYDLINILNKYGFNIQNSDFSFIEQNLSVFFVIVLIIFGAFFLFTGSKAFLRSLNA